MKAIEFKEQTIIIAENQEEYESLPAKVDPSGVVTCCMEINAEEAEEIKEFQELWVSRLLFGSVAQPMKIFAEKPEFPVSNKAKFVCHPDNFTELDGVDGVDVAVFKIKLSQDEAEKIIENKCFWIATATYRSAFQPIMLSCCG